MSWTITDDYLGTSPDDQLGGLGGGAERPEIYSGPAEWPGAQEMTNFGGAADFSGNALPGSQVGGNNRRGQGDMFMTPADIQGQGLNQGNWMGAQGYAGNVNRQTADQFANLPRDLAANIPAITSGDQPMTALDVQRSGLHQNDYAAAQRYADSVNRTNAATFAGLTPEQVGVMNQPPPQRGAVGANLPGTDTGGPQAMAAGEGWYIDSHGRFISDNMGANARANTFYDANPTIGPGTILDFPGGPRSAVGVGQGLGQGLRTAQDFLAGRDRYGNPNQLPDYLGLTGQGMGVSGFGGLTLPGAAGQDRTNQYGGVSTAAALAAAGVPNATGVPLGGGLFNNTGPYANFIPRRGDTLSETYGPFGGAAAAGTGTQGGVRGQTLSDRQRVITDDQGRVVAVRDPDGYIAPGGQWSTKREILQNIFDPGAREKLALLGRMGDQDALTVLSGLNPDMINSQQAANVFAAHNADIRRGAPGIGWNPPANPVEDQRAFPVEYALIDVMRKDGVPVSNTLVNGNIAYQDTDGRTRYIPAWQAGQKLADYNNRQQG